MNGIHVERVGDELLITLHDDDGEPIGTASVPIPGGVSELIDAIRAEAW